MDWSDAKDECISNHSRDASNVLIKEQQKEKSHDEKRHLGSREEDLVDDGEINGSNEAPPTKTT